jgi:cytoskeletal protein RodZ
MSANESKPEWFQLADEDWAANPAAIEARVNKARRRNPIKIMAISTPLLVLGAGLFFAQSQQTPDAFAASVPTVATSQAAPTSGSAGFTATTSATSATTENSQPPVATTTNTTTTNQVPVASAPQISTPSTSSALSTLQSGLVLPAKGSVQSGDDDGESQDD